ncbi:hypothetical protein VNO78_01119 [Psophocarpus tetragonolobus]|uniref:Uncharacterized protein n=1 Tax=Psophocarpus tetragonolobus TaxID=3891 RepID=A0AAN9SXP3_PSOTE
MEMESKLWGHFQPQNSLFRFVLVLYEDSCSQDPLDVGHVGVAKVMEMVWRYIDHRNPGTEVECITNSKILSGVAMSGLRLIHALTWPRCLGTPQKATAQLGGRGAKLTASCVAVSLRSDAREKKVTGDEFHFT